MKRFTYASRLLLAVCVLAVLAMCQGSQAFGASPKWRLSTFTPDSVNAGNIVRLDAWVENVGNVPLTGSVTIAFTFPVGVAPVEPEIQGTVFGSTCQIVGQTTTCVIDVHGMVPGGQTRLRYFPALDPEAAGVLTNRISASGGGMPETQTREEAMTVGLVEPFSIRSFAVGFFDGEGEPSSQAGFAPAEALSTLRFRTATSHVVVQGDTAPVERFKDTIVHLPAGMVGDPTATPVRCTAAQLSDFDREGVGERTSDCPEESQVGIVHLIYLQPGGGPDVVALYNMVPRPGVPAELGFLYQAEAISIVAHVRPSDHGIDLESPDAVSSVAISEVDVTLWGVPADSSHDYLRHLCTGGWHGNVEGRRCPSKAPRRAFLRTPTSCTGPLPWSAEVSTYTHPETFVHAEATSPGLTGCELLPFAPSFALTPHALTPDTPTGLDATVSLPQERAPEGLATADLRTATVTLPQGLSLNPSSAAGLQACGDADLKLGVDGAATCPDASKVGTVSLTTPLIDHPLSGSIFVRPQASDDPASGNLFRIAVEIRSDDDGVDIKLPAAVKVDPATGQMTTIFEDQPQLPFSSFTLHFMDGPRAPLATPSGCGSYSTTANFDAWSGKAVSTASSFAISGDGHGGACAPQGFSPVLTAGTENPVAGAFSPFTSAADEERCRSGALFDFLGASAGGSAREHRLGAALHRRAGCGGGVPGFLASGERDGRCGRGSEPVLCDGRQRVPDGALQGCAVRDGVRCAREGRPVRPRHCGGAGRAAD